MTREAAACNASAANLYSCQQNLHSCQQTQRQFRARDTITKNVHCRLPPDKMLLGLRTIVRNARQGPKRIGEVYRGPESSLRCTGCASNVFSEASYSTCGHQSPASGSSLQDDGRRLAVAFGSLSRHFSSWARDGMGTGDQLLRNVAAHARARGRGSLASTDPKQVGSGTSRVEGTTLDGHEILRAAEEERVSSFASDGSAEGKVTIVDEEVSGVSADLRDENRPIEETGAESVGSVPGISGGGQLSEETRLDDRQESGTSVVNASDECGSAGDASTVNSENLQLHADSLSAESGVSEVDLNPKPAKPKISSVSEAPARKGKLGKGSVAGTKVSSETPSGRGKPASAEKSKKDPVTDPVKSRVFKETGRRPLSTAARASAEERRKKEEMKQLPATDLLTVKGIGPTYVGRFMEQGYKSVKDLEDLYKEKVRLSLVLVVCAV
jgi:predicted flap endonuclease-1-like 5' DNA nuclease